MLRNILPDAGRPPGASSACNRAKKRRRNILAAYTAGLTPKFQWNTPARTGEMITRIPASGKGTLDLARSELCYSVVKVFQRSEIYQ